jgi:hypothetical protein
LEKNKGGYCDAKIINLKEDIKAKIMMRRPQGVCDLSRVST